MMTGCWGRNSGRRRGSADQTSSTTPMSTEVRPIVTMKTETGLSLSSGRIIVRSMTPPMRAATTSVAGTEAQMGSARPAENP